MKPISLRKLFFTNTTIVAVTVMVMSAVIVDITFRKELEKSTHENLRLHVFTILSVAQMDRDKLIIPDILYNPRFNTRNSGLFAVVLDEAKHPVWRSLSIDSAPDNLGLSLTIGGWRFTKTTIDASDYYTAAYKLAWEDDRRRHTYHVIAAEEESILQDNIQRFRLWLFGVFFAITATLLLCQLVVLYLAFRPISRLENEILALEQGKQQTLSPNYPKELGGVTYNLNTLIHRERRQRERYRTGMADLAHSLKTPMAVISAEIAAGGDVKIVQNAIARIDKNIEYQLRRAVFSGHSLLTNGTDIRDVLDLVVEALQKIYCEKSVDLRLQASEALLFFGDENDLTEIFGNLLDNAYKCARSEIHVTVDRAADTLVIIVEDDGEGLSAEDASKIFHRGERLDRRDLGHGIGLAVVVDIVNSYEGHIETGTSALGGALFKITFPLRETAV